MADQLPLELAVALVDLVEPPALLREQAVVVPVRGGEACVEVRAAARCRAAPGRALNRRCASRRGASSRSTSPARSRRRPRAGLRARPARPRSPRVASGAPAGGSSRPSCVLARSRHSVLLRRRRILPVATAPGVSGAAALGGLRTRQYNRSCPTPSPIRRSPPSAAGSRRRRPPTPKPSPSWIGVAGFALPEEEGPELLEALAAANAAEPAEPARGAGLAGVLGRRFFDVAPPAGRAPGARRRRAGAAAQPPAEPAGRLNGSLRALAAGIVGYAQRVDPVMDARDQLRVAEAPSDAQLLLEAFERRIASLRQRLRRSARPARPGRARLGGAALRARSARRAAPSRGGRRPPYARPPTPPLHRVREPLPRRARGRSARGRRTTCRCSAASSPSRPRLRPGRVPGGLLRAAGDRGPWRRGQRQRRARVPARGARRGRGRSRRLPR